MDTGILAHLSRRLGLTFATAILALPVLAGAAQAFTIGVSPSRFEFAIGTRPVAEAVQVFNQGDAPIDVAVRVAHFDLDENNRVREIAPTEQSLDQWMIVRPLSLTIPPGETRTVRFAVRPYVQPSPGEHRAMIFFEHDNPSPPGSSTIQLRFRMGIAVYGHAGPKDRATRLHGVAASAAGFGVDFETVGNAHARMKGRYAVWPADAFPGAGNARARLMAASEDKGVVSAPAGAERAGRLPSTPVLPGYRRTVSHRLREALPPGRYTLVLAGRLGDGPLAHTETFTVRE